MEHGIITISRQYGSGGRLIGEKLAERLHIPFYDKEIIELSAKQSDVSGNFFSQPEKSGNYILRDFFSGIPLEMPISDKIYLAQYAVISALAKNGPCVIVGRGAGAALNGVVPLLNIFIYADIETRKRRAIEEYGDNPQKIEEHIASIDKKRASYFRFYTGMNGKEMENYHLCIDSGKIGIEGAVAAIEMLYLLK
ncbi:MAG: cytidylate kinase-like family protein [Clostridia bacterium]